MMNNVYEGPVHWVPPTLDDCPFSEESNAIIKAITYCDFKGIDIFFDNGGNINEFKLAGESPLIFAIKNSSWKYAAPCEDLDEDYNEVILRLLKEGINVDVIDTESKMTPLMLALECKRSDKVVRQLLGSGCDVNAVCIVGKTPLMYAIQNGHFVDKISEDISNGENNNQTTSTGELILRELISKGADINHRCCYGKTPLFYALECCTNPDIIKMLINSGSDINTKCDQGKNALMYAVVNNVHKCILKELIKNNSDINCKCFSGRNALSYAVEFCKDPEIINLLINAGSDTNNEDLSGNTVLLYAIMNNCEKIITLELIKKCTNVNQVSKSGFPPLFHAVSKENIDYDLITALICAGAGFHHHSYDDCNLLLMINCKNCAGGVNCKFKELIDTSLRSGVDLNKTDRNGNTILHITNCKYLMELAVMKDINIDTTNFIGYTPLMESVKKNDVEKVNMLLKLGANPNLPYPPPFASSTMLECIDNEMVVELILYHGGNLFTKNFDVAYIVSVSRFGEAWYSGRKYRFEIVKHLLLFHKENDFISYAARWNLDQEFLVKCKNEVEKMRCFLIKENLSFHEFCILKKTYRSKFIRISYNEYNYNFDKIKEMFPLYRNLIIRRVKDNHKYQFYRTLRNSLEKIVIRPISVCDDNLNVDLGFDSWYQICQYFNHKNLYNLFLASF